MLPPKLREWGTLARMLPPKLREWGTLARMLPPKLREWGTLARMLSQILAHGNSKNEISKRERERERKRCVSIERSKAGTKNEVTKA